MTNDGDPGQSIGPYRLIRPLGRGGMGEVFLAEDTRLGRRVAVKSLRPKLSASPHFTSHLLREARAAARLNHPNIAQVYDVVPTEGRMHIVMEHLEGETLAERISRTGPLPPGDAAAVGAQIAAALEHAHGQGILHCDMKPGNVFVTAGGTVKVLDFGLARVIDDESGATDAGVGATPTLLEMRAGTPAYMSPEQRLGRPVDQRTDIYSAGLVLQEICSGRPAPPTPLDFDTTQTTPVPAVDGAIPDPLRGIIARCISLAPQDRYASAAALKDALEDVAGERSGARARTSRPVWTPRRAAWLAGAGAVIAVAAMLTRPWWPGPGVATPARPPVVAIVPFSASDASVETRYLAAGVTELVTDYLSVSPALVVVSNNASRAAAANAKPMEEISRELGAAYVIGGTLQPQGGKVVVALNVYDAAKRRSEPGAVFQTTLSDVIADSPNLADAVRQHLRDAGVPVASDARRQAAVTSRAALEDYAQGRELLERFGVADNLDRAIVLFGRSIERDPMFALAHAALGEASWRKYRRTRDKQWAKKAQDSAFEAMRLAPTEARVRYTAAVVLRGTGRTTEAEDELQRALQAQPNYAEAHRLLGTLLAEAGRLDAAVSEFQSALALQPESPETHHAMGLAYFDHGRFEDAVRAFAEETRLRPDRASAFQALGASYHGLGRLDDALRNYEKAIHIAPSALAYSNIGLIRYRQKQYAGAVDAYRHSAELEPNIPETHRNLADSLAKAGDQAAARQSYERAITLADEQLTVNPRDGKLVGLKAVCFAKLRRPAQARAAAAAASALSPSDGEVQFLAAAAFAVTGDKTQAERLIRRALDLGFSRSIVEQDEDLVGVLPGR